MRLLVLCSLVSNGLKPKIYDEVRNSIAQFFGFDKLLLLHNLQKLGRAARRSADYARDIPADVQGKYS